MLVWTEPLKGPAPLAVACMSIKSLSMAEHHIPWAPMSQMAGVDATNRNGERGMERCCTCGMPVPAICNDQNPCMSTTSRRVVAHCLGLHLKSFGDLCYDGSLQVLWHKRACTPHCRATWTLCTACTEPPARLMLYHAFLRIATSSANRHGLALYAAYYAWT